MMYSIHDSKKELNTNLQSDFDDCCGKLLNVPGGQA